MASTDAAFAGSIPGLYDRHLRPLLFEPYAEEVADRALKFEPRWILETAAGTGIVTAALARAIPEAHMVGTDLNQAMLDVARTRIASGNIQFEVADALDLPFEAGSFDLVVCQFGVMFYPDRVRGNAEARRVLREGGRYMVVVWDRLERNPASHAVHEAVAALYPDNPPGFLARTPFGYHDPAIIEHDLLQAGFTDIEFETVELRSMPNATARDAARGFVLGSPLRAELEERDPKGLDGAVEAAEQAASRLNGPRGFDSRLSAHVVTATKT
jgi:ubiquinone/menaquinone biosynthesis C-methylase UbiE